MTNMLLLFIYVTSHSLEEQLNFVCYLIGPSLGPCCPELSGGILLAEVLELCVAGNVDASHQVELKSNGFAIFSDGIRRHMDQEASSISG